MTMTLEELRESLDVGCLPNTDRPSWFVAIDAAIRERDELRTAYTSASQSRDYWKECAGRASSDLAALKARMKPCAQVVGGEVRALMDPDDEGKYVAVLVVEE